MEENNHGKKGGEKTAQDDDVFRWWNERSTILPGDSFNTKVSKILIKLLGILFLVIFSPLLLIALLIAFLVAL